MAGKLEGRKVAIVVANGFEQVEMVEPRKALEREGATTELVSPEHGGKVKGWKHVEWGDEFEIGLPIEKADPDAFDALLLPGGVMNPDRLRRNRKVLSFVRSFFERGKPVAAICHGPWTLIDAGVTKGRRMTSWPSLQSDLENAGVSWVDQEVVADRGLVTSRKPDDIPAFDRVMIEEFAANGGHAAQVAAPRGDGGPGRHRDAR